MGKINILQLQDGATIKQAVQDVQKIKNNTIFSVTDTLTVTTNGQTTLTLKHTPNTNAVKLYINGVMYNENLDFTVDRTAKTLTWTSIAFSLNTEDNVVAQYYILGDNLEGYSANINASEKNGILSLTIDGQTYQVSTSGSGSGGTTNFKVNNTTVKAITINGAEVSFESDTAIVSVTGDSDTIATLTAKVTALESYHAESIGIVQLKSGLRVGQWQSVDNDNSSMNGDAVDTTNGSYIGIEQTASGNSFGDWQFVEGSDSTGNSGNNSGATGAEVTALQETVAALTTALNKALKRIEQLEGYHAEIVGIEQLKAGLRVGHWQSVDAEGNNLNSDTEDYDEVIVQKIETVGIEQLTSGAGFGTWKQVA